VTFFTPDRRVQPAGPLASYDALKAYLAEVAPLAIDTLERVTLQVPQTAAYAAADLSTEP
jgi:hypothetical protein